MQYKSLQDVNGLADVSAKPIVPETMTKAERLERWADLLARRGNALLTALRGTEYQSPETRGRMREENSPFSVAYADPVLREAGLKGDTYEDAKRFFQVSDGELHYVVCHCHAGSTISSYVAAERVRSLAPVASRLRTFGRAVMRWLS
jgi:hypothetical protein